MRDTGDIVRMQQVFFDGDIIQTDTVFCGIQKGSDRRHKIQPGAKTGLEDTERSFSHCEALDQIIPLYKYMAGLLDTTLRRIIHISVDRVIGYTVLPV